MHHRYGALRHLLQGSGGTPRLAPQSGGDAPVHPQRLERPGEPVEAVLPHPGRVKSEENGRNTFEGQGIGSYSLLRYCTKLLYGPVSVESEITFENKSSGSCTTTGPLPIKLLIASSRTLGAFLSAPTSAALKSL